MRKRERTLEPYLYTLFLILWTGIGIIYFMVHFSWILIIINILLISCFIYDCMGVVFLKELTEITKFTIYEYEIFSGHYEKYIKKYYVDETEIYAKFIYHYHLEDIEEENSINEVESYIENIENSQYIDDQIFTSKEEAMVYKKIIKELIKTEKVKNNVLIKNVKISEGFTTKELKEIVENEK